MNGISEIRPVAKRHVLKALIRDAVVGIGLYQGVEFIKHYYPCTWHATMLGDRKTALKNLQSFAREGFHVQSLLVVG